MISQPIALERARHRQTLGHALMIIVLTLLASTVVLEPGPSAGNIASEGTVTMSSNCNKAPRGAPGPVRPELLIDGRRSRFYDACTRGERGAWVRIDLPRLRRIESIKVFGRGDCCWDQAGFPLLAELSIDGTNFSAIARRQLPFTRSDPWIIGVESADAKAIRVRGESSRTELVLSEIELIEARD